MLAAHRVEQKTAQVLLLTLHVMTFILALTIFIIQYLFLFIVDFFLGLYQIN